MADDGKSSGTAKAQSDGQQGGASYAEVSDAAEVARWKQEESAGEINPSAPGDTGTTEKIP